MEAVHAWENVKFLAKQSFKTLFTFVAWIYLDAPIFDHPQLVLQLLSIRWVAIHQQFQPAYLSWIAF